MVSVLRALVGKAEVVQEQMWVVWCVCVQGGHAIERTF